MDRFIKTPQSIIIFRALQLGDLLCAVPAVRALKSAFPKAEITLAGLPWAATFVDRFSHYLDHFIEFPGWPGLPEQEPSIEQIPSFLKAVQNGRFDLALQMQGSGSITNPLVMAFGARQTAGFYQPGQYQPDSPFFYPYPHGLHEIHVFLRLVESLGIPDQGEHLEFPISDEERQSCERFCSLNGLEPGEYVCLHPGARSIERRWAPEKFAQVGNALSALGLKVVLTGTTPERGLTQAIASQMHFPVLDAAGQTDLGTLASLIAGARLVISNDTGTSHLAAVFETPSIILFSASDPNRWRPLNQEIHRIIPNASLASPDDVMNEARQLFDEAHSYARPWL